MKIKLVSMCLFLLLATTRPLLAAEIKPGELIGQPCNEQNFKSFMIWAAGPGYKVDIDRQKDGLRELKILEKYKWEVGALRNMSEKDTDGLGGALQYGSYPDEGLPYDISLSLGLKHPEVGNKVEMLPVPIYTFGLGSESIQCIERKIVGISRVPFGDENTIKSMMAEKYGPPQTTNEQEAPMEHYCEEQIKRTLSANIYRQTWGDILLVHDKMQCADADHYSLTVYYINSSSYTEAITRINRELDEQSKREMQERNKQRQLDDVRLKQSL
jgi:hypothetical protein